MTAGILEQNTEERPSGSGLIQSVVMTGQIIEALAAAGQPMRLTALANHLGEPKARMHRHLSTLKYLGFVDQDAQTECYKLGPKLAHIGQAAMDQFDLRRLAEPYMLKLRDLTGQTVVLSIPASGDAIVSAACESANLVTISVRLGYRLAGACVGAGQDDAGVFSARFAAARPRTETAVFHTAHHHRRGSVTRPSAAHTRPAFRSIDGRNAAWDFGCRGADPQL